MFDGVKPPAHLHSISLLPVPESPKITLVVPIAVLVPKYKPPSLTVILPEKVLLPVNIRFERPFLIKFPPPCNVEEIVAF